MVGAQIVTALQTVVARESRPTEPAVVTVGAFRAGEAFNVIPDTAELRGTVRSFSQDAREFLAERIEALVRGVGGAMRAGIDVQYHFGYPPTVNDPAMTDLVRSVATEVVGANKVIDDDLHMGAEDFSFFLERVPGCFFFVGSRNEERGLIWGHHHPRFDIDEAVLASGMETMTATVLRYLGR
jgi:amidohydrolase